MRKISYKAKKKDWKELPSDEQWVEGHLLITDSGYFIAPLSGIVKIDKLKYYVCKNLITTFAFEVDPETICQYTEFKDKKGKKIFDGDILNCYYDTEYPEEGIKQRVLWHDGGWAIQEKYSNGVSKLEKYDYECGVVIGNIFDNPELIKESE